MAVADKELTPVIYSAAAIKVLHFARKAGRKCFRMHWHDRMELIRVRAGELVADYGTNTGTVFPDELWIVPPKMPHKGTAGAEDVVYDVLMFDVRSFFNDTPICREYLSALFEGKARFVMKTADPETVQCFDAIYAAAGNPTLAITAGIYRLLDLFFSRSLLEFREEIGKDAAAREMVTYIEENFAEDLSSASLAAQFGYTSAHFCRKFKEVTGLSPMSYLKIFRLEEAYKRIRAGERSISTIAADCGFSDANYFTRCFRAHFGVPPSHFKKANA